MYVYRDQRHAYTESGGKETMVGVNKRIWQRNMGSCEGGRSVILYGSF